MLFNILIFIPVMSILLQQPQIDTTLYLNPLAIEQFLSGSFCELRSTRFHTGIDIKTNTQIGSSVYAIEDGYVSRISVSPVGYGKVLYINHYNGLTSVYAHLNDFNTQIGAYVYKKQYEQKSFAVDLLPDTDFIKVRKGEVIGDSGNSGSSQGPHLHFEIRKTSTQDAIDPMLYNFVLKDTIAPKFHDLYLYPLDANSAIAGQQERYHANVIKNGANTPYSLSVVDTIKAFGNFGIGAHIDDYTNNSKNKCGIVKLNAFANGENIYELNLSQISFKETHYAKSLIDYELSNKKRQYVYKCFVERGNKFSNYTGLVNRGVINIQNNHTVNIKILAADSYNNISELVFVVKGDSTILKRKTSPVFKQKWIPNSENVFEDENIKVTTKYETLYDTVYFNYEIFPQKPKTDSKTYKTGNIYNPINGTIQILLKNEKLPEKNQGKTIIVACGGKSIWAVSNTPLQTPEGITFNASSFGEFALAQDTTPPDITILNIKANENISLEKSIRVKISDNLTGIETYNGYIDNTWVLFEYDAKSNLLEYAFDDNMPTGDKHLLKIEVIDKVGNQNTKTINFTKKTQNH